MKDKYIQIILKQEKNEEAEAIEYIDKRYKHLSMKALFLELVKRDMEGGK